MVDRTDHTEDVPSPIDLRSVSDAQEWAATVAQKRPWRKDFFSCFVGELISLGREDLRILELGSGPGHLARNVLMALPRTDYTALDFSPAMQDLAREHLGELRDSVHFLVADFRKQGWGVGLGEFDAILTNQAVHELRHKKHAPLLHRTVRSLLRSAGLYLVCDHHTGSDGLQNDRLYMSVEEQRQCLADAGFSNVIKLLELHGMVLHRASASGVRGEVVRD